jgi:hypothetical protein
VLRRRSPGRDASSVGDVGPASDSPRMDVLPEGPAWFSANRTRASVRFRDERYESGRRSQRGGCGNGLLP